MAGYLNLSPARAFLLGLALAALSACASTPAPISAGGGYGRGPQGDQLPALPEAENEARVTDYAANLQCVPFARQLSGVQIFGNANTWWTQAAGVMHARASRLSGPFLCCRGIIRPPEATSPLSLTWIPAA